MNTIAKVDKVIIAAVEGGGTSFKVAVAEIGNEKNIPTVLYQDEVDSSHDKPEKTLQECAAFFQKHKPNGGYHALGLATFGPVGLNKDNKNTYGHILSTSPKKSWRNVDLLTPLIQACRGSRSLGVQVETDVNAPAFAEYLLCKNNNSPITSTAYITVGTGVGVGLVIHGKPVHGRMHPEGGHVPVQPLEGDTFPGYSWGQLSPFKGRQTVEGLACSVALTERLEQIIGKQNLPRSCLADLPDNHEIWDHAANALANLCTTLILTTSVEKIVIGGGIMKRKCLIEKIQSRTIELLNGYLSLPTDNMSTLIATSTYGDNVGLVGALVLAQNAYKTIKEGRVGGGETKIGEGGGLSPFMWGVIHGIVLGVGVGAVAAVQLTRTKK